MFFLFTAHLCIAIWHQSDGHDVVKDEPSREEHPDEKHSAAGTQALIVKRHLDWIIFLMPPGEVMFKALLQNLHRWWRPVG